MSCQLNQVISFIVAGKSDKDKPISNLPILSLDELLNKEIALSYYLDYLSILNLQKYVIFYLTAQGELTLQCGILIWPAKKFILFS